MFLSATQHVVATKGSERSPQRIRRFAPVLVILLVASLACASSGGSSRKGKPGSKMQIAPAELQVKVRSLADPFSGAIEEAVWELWATDDDPEWRRNLLMWQINVINAIQRAVFQPRPLAALFDTWALVEQLRSYTTTGRGSARSEEQRRIVLDAVDGMENRLFKIAVEAGGEQGASEAQQLVREWAEAHPIDRFVVRASPASELAQWTARGNMGALATVKSLGASLDDVMARIDLYAEYIPKQASWQAELVAGQIVPPTQIEQAFDDLTVTAAAFDRIAASLEGYPALVSDERGIIIETVREERIAILGELLAKLTELQLFVNEERVDMMETQVTAQREAVLQAVAAERAIIIDAAIKERADTMVEFEEMVDGLVERSATKVVDHLFMRALQLVGLILLGIALIAIVVVVLWKRK